MGSKRLLDKAPDLRGVHEVLLNVLFLIKNHYLEFRIE
jgi:hypothetical protein